MRVPILRGMKAASSLLLAALFFAPYLAIAQEASPEEEAFDPDKLISVFGAPAMEKPEGLSSCFDHYRFGSTPVTIAGSHAEAVAGSAVEFTGSVANENDYAIADASVWAKVMRTRTTGKDVNAPDVVDWFRIADNLTLPPGGSVPIEGRWEVPKDARNGEYHFATFVVASDRFNFEGLSFTDDIVGSRYHFSVVGGRDGVVAFDKDDITAVGYPFSFAAFPPHVEKDLPARITAGIDNATDLPFTGTVEWKLYAWDAVTEDHLIDAKTQTVQIHPGSSSTAEYEITDTEHGAYYLVGSLTTAEGAKSIIGIRVARDGINAPRLNFVGIDPDQGTDATAVACVHTIGNGPLDGAKVTLSAYRTGFVGSILNLFGPAASATYEGRIVPDIYALTLPIDLENPVRVTATLEYAGATVDQVTVDSCSGACPRAEPGVLELSLAIAAAVLLAGFLLMRMARRRPPAPPIAPTPS